jgi:hypothetical protein
VRKCGGEKALTKPNLDEGLPKYHMPLEEANKLIENNVKLLSSTDFAICGPTLSSPKACKPKFTVAKPRAKVTSLKSKLGKIMHRLYDLEPDNQPEKPLNIDLGVELYQMEDF